MVSQHVREQMVNTLKGVQIVGDRDMSMGQWIETYEWMDKMYAELGEMRTGMLEKAEDMLANVDDWISGPPCPIRTEQNFSTSFGTFHNRRRSDGTKLTPSDADWNTGVQLARSDANYVSLDDLIYDYESTADPEGYKKDPRYLAAMAYWERIWTDSEAAIRLWREEHKEWAEYTTVSRLMRRHYQ